MKAKICGQVAVSLDLTCSLVALCVHRASWCRVLMDVCGPPTDVPRALGRGSHLANWNLLSPERSLPGTCRGDRTAAPGASVCLGKMCARAVPVGLFYMYLVLSS